MKRALVIVDAWKSPGKRGDCGIPFLVERDTKAFGTFLNRVCKYERDKKTLIIHCPTNFEIMDEIEVYDDDVIFNHNPPEVTFEDWQKLFIDNDINEIYFGGFHFGRCIHSYVHELYRDVGLVESTKIGIVLNLSMVYPGDSWLYHIENSERRWDSPDPTYNWYLWCQHKKGSFQKIKVERDE